SYRARIFVRMRLYLLALAPSSAPDLVAAYLADFNLIDADWCREEYASLARAWFRHLAPPTQQNASIAWGRCLALVQAVLENNDYPVLVPAPGDDPDWSWTLKAMIDWLSAALA